jgi:p-hydroxybenzoate 3-monooxygenase
MTQMLHIDPNDDEYGRQLQLSHGYVSSSTAAATSRAENYVGVPTGSASQAVVGG